MYNTASKNLANNKRKNIISNPRKAILIGLGLGAANGCETPQAINKAEVQAGNFAYTGNAIKLDELTHGGSLQLFKN